MNKEYNDIELTDDEIASLEDPILTDISTSDDVKTETTTSQDETTQEEPADEAVKESDVVEDNESVEVKTDEIEIDGNTYNLDTIKEWMNDSNNKQEWQKSNTQKSQELSKWGKFVEKVNKDDEFRNHIKDYFFDNPEEVSKLGLDGKIGLEIEDADETQVPSELEQRLELLEKFEQDRIVEHRVNSLDSELTKLEKEYPEYLGEDKQVSEFLDFAQNNGQRFLDNGIPNLNKAFKEWSYDQMQEELAHYKKLGENSKRNEGKIVNSSQVGAKEVKSPKKILSWNDATMDNPEIAKYFEE